MKARAKELGLGIWYKIEMTSDIDEILQTHLCQKRRVARLMLTERDVPPAKG